MLICPVRDCRLPLRREERRVVCGRGHSFDIARSGYINLLQPQDRRSRHPGDTAQAVAGRRRLHDLGVTRPLLEAIAAIARPAPTDTILDAGCGDGFYLAGLAPTGHGIDISVAAIEAAARRYPAHHWIVANADRFIPWAPASFSLILSVTARMNPAEFRRALRNDGRLLVAIPAPDDLVELRGPGRDLIPRTVETFAPTFTLAETRRATTTADLDAPAVQDLLHSVYRPRTACEATQVTFSLDLLLFRPALPTT